MKLFIISSCLLVILMAALTKSSVLDNKYEEEEDTLDFGDFLEKQLTREPPTCCCGALSTACGNKPCPANSQTCHSPYCFSAGGKCVGETCCHANCKDASRLCNRQCVKKCTNIVGCCRECTLAPSDNCLPTDCNDCTAAGDTCQCKVVGGIKQCVCVHAQCPLETVCSANQCAFNPCPSGQRCECQADKSCLCVCDTSVQCPAPNADKKCPGSDTPCLPGTTTCVCTEQRGCVCGPCDPLACPAPLADNKCGSDICPGSTTCICTTAKGCTCGPCVQTECTSDCPFGGSCGTGTCVCNLCDPSNPCPPPGADNKCGTTSCPGSETCTCNPATGCNVCGPCVQAECTKDCPFGGSCDTGKCVCTAPPTPCTNGCKTDITWNINTCGGTNPNPAPCSGDA